MVSALNALGVSAGGRRSGANNGRASAVARLAAILDPGSAATTGGEGDAIGAKADTGLSSGRTGAVAKSSAPTSGTNAQAATPANPRNVTRTAPETLGVGLRRADTPC